MRRWSALHRHCTAAAAAVVAAAARAATTRVPPSAYGSSFTITPRVWQRIAAKNAEDGVTSSQRHLRLAIESGGCHGFLYKFSFEPHSEYNADEDIRVCEADVTTTVSLGACSSSSSSSSSISSSSSSGSTDDAGANAAATTTATTDAGGGVVVVDKLTAGKMQNAVLDYHSELKGSAFVVVGNELLDQSCACAMSFSLKRRPTTPVTGTAAAAPPLHNMRSRSGSEGSTSVADGSATASHATSDGVEGGLRRRGSNATALRRGAP